MINKVVTGDLVKMAKNGEFDVIAHGCNCFNTMGAGIAKQIKQEFPGAFKVDCETVKGDRYKLGDYTFSEDDPSCVIFNLYTQYDYRGKNPVDYKAIRTVFSTLNLHFSNSNRKVGIPMIGAGLAGGDWDKISSIIDEVTPDLDITLVKYKP